MLGLIADYAKAADAIQKSPDYALVAADRRKKALPKPLRTKLYKAMHKCQKSIDDKKISKSALASSVFELQKSFYAAYLLLAAEQK